MTIAALLLLFFAGTQALLPPFVQARVEEALLAHFPRTQALQVRLNAFPAVRLLQGYVGSVDIEAEGLRLGDLPLDRFRLWGRGVRVDVGHLLRTGELRILAAAALDARAEVSEEAVNRYLREEVDPTGLFTATVEADGLRLDGELELLGRPVNIVIQGGFEVQGGNRVEFLPRHVAVDDAVIPRFILDSLARSEQFRVGLDLGTFPVPLEVRDVFFEPGRIIVEARQPTPGGGVRR